MQISELLSRLEGVKGHSGQYMAKCPAHEDKRASLCVSRGDDGRILMKCQAGCSTEAVTAALGLSMTDLFPEKPQKYKKIVATYQYKDESGNLLGEKVRYDDKSFCWRQPDGKGGWNYSRKGIAPTLYGTGGKPLPSHVYLVEGEKDADNLNMRSAPAVSVPDGAQSKWRPQYTRALTGRHVVILPDNDNPGRELAERAAKELEGKAATIKIIDLKKGWDWLPEKGDISDILAREPSEDVFLKLEELEEKAPEWKEEKEEHSLQTISAKELQNKKLSPPNFIVLNLLPQGLSLLASPPKYGKSWLVLDLCLSVASGSKFLNHQTQKGGCLYLALEDSEWRLQERMNDILNGKEAPEGFDYATSALAIGEGLIGQLEEYIKNSPNTKLIVIDTLQKVRASASGKENAYSADYREMGILKAFSDRHGICLFLVHHLRKMGDDGDPFNRISGTNGIFGAADTAFVMTKERRNDTKITFSIVGRDIESQEIIMEFNKEEHRWNAIGDADALAEQQAREEYESSPIVATIKKLLEQSPAGWCGTMQELLDAGIHFSGTYLASTPRDLSSKLKALDKPLFDYDHIVHDRGKNGNAGYKHKLFYGFIDTIEKRKPIQTKLSNVN